jgi:peptide deformylase
MTIRPIVRYPDPRLAIPARPVTEFDDALREQGSVSKPGLNDEVRRHARIRISYQDVDGNMQTEESDGLRAVCHQHEIDQLSGLFWINRLSRLKRER